MKQYEESTVNDKNYVLPDESVVTIKKDRFRCSEVFFDPSIVDNDLPGIHELICSSIMRNDSDCRIELSSNIVISGGTSMLLGFQGRLKNELETTFKNLSQTMNVNIIAPPKRDLSCWIGGSILSSLSTFKNISISRNEFDEVGSVIVHRKCF